MISPYMLLFGYLKYILKNEDVRGAAELFLKNNISVKFHKNTFLISARKASEIDKILDGKIEYTKGEMLGLGGFVRKNKKRYGVISALVLTASRFSFTSVVIVLITSSV